MKTFVLAALALGLAGCKSATPVTNPDGTTTNANGSVTVPAQSAPSTMAIRNQDGSITNPDGSVTYPAGSNVANRESNPTPQYVAPAPTPVNSAPIPAPVSVAEPTAPIGTIVAVRITQSLSASRSEVGERFTGVLDAPVKTRGGGIVFAAGTPVSGEVVSARGRGKFKGAGDIGVSLTAIGRDQVETNVYERNSPGKGKRTAGFIGGGAGLGALIGGLAGGGKGALIGGLAGAGGGTAAGAYTGNHDVVIPSESRITFRLTQALRR